MQESVSQICLNLIIGMLSLFYQKRFSTCFQQENDIENYYTLSVVFFFS